MDKYTFNKHQKYIRTINFDLDTHALEEKYPKKNWRRAYDDIGDFLEARGFSHRQGSGYISDKEISMLKVTKTLNELKREFPYFIGCVNKIDVASIVDTRFDYGYIFEPTNAKAKANEKADAVEKDNNMSDDKTVDDPQDWRDSTDDEDEELDLTGQSQSRGRS